MKNEETHYSGRVPKELLDLINLKYDDPWDVILVGDGSGSRWNYGGGWATVLFDKQSEMRKLNWGALSDTTINICELSPYIYAMMWYHRGPANAVRALKRKNGDVFGLVNVHIVTDCAIIAQQGARTAERDANGPLWASMDAFERAGFKFHYHWIPRDRFSANRLCDVLSKDMRHIVESIERRTDEKVLPDAYCDHYGQPIPPEEQAQ